jgi:hypothetical protein
LGHFLAEIEGLSAAVIHLLVAALFCIKVILSRFARDKLPVAGYFEPLSE